MSLADDLLVVEDNRCAACRWYAALTEDDRVAFDAYVASMLEEAAHPQPGRKVIYTKAFLYEKCCANGLQMGGRAFRNHLADHHKPS